MRCYCCHCSCPPFCCSHWPTEVRAREVYKAVLDTELGFAIFHVHATAWHLQHKEMLLNLTDPDIKSGEHLTSLQELQYMHSNQCMIHYQKNQPAAMSQ